MCDSLSGIERKYNGKKLKKPKICFALVYLYCLLPRKITTQSSVTDLCKNKLGSTLPAWLAYLLQFASLESLISVGMWPTFYQVVMEETLIITDRNKL